MSLRTRFDIAVLVEGEAGDLYRTVGLKCPTSTGFQTVGGAQKAGEDVHTFNAPVQEGCTIEVVRHHGSLRLHAQPVPVRATTSPQDLVLPSPPLPATGLGAYATDGGLRIDAIERGSRGDRAGLQVRDLVVLDAPTDDVEGWLNRKERMRVSIERDGSRFETWL